MKEIGTIAYTTKGVYSPDATYQPMNVVLYAGSLWECTAETTENTPPDHQYEENGDAASNDYWRLFLPGASRDDYVKKTDIAEAPTDTTPGKAGIVIPDGETITVDENGKISGSAKVDTATTEKAGIVKPDNDTIIVSDGTIAAIKAGFTGTMEEYESANSAGQIPDGAIVNITDDYTPTEPTDSKSVKILLQQQQGIYDGRDLTQVFADEIAEFGDPWAWIKNRIVNANYEGIYVADFIPMTINGENHEMQVAGIDTYYRTTDQNLGHHIDFISRDCYSQNVRWNTTNNNNGNATNPCPYMVSNLKAFLDTLYESLPTAVKNVVVSKRTLLEQRYSASGALTDSTGFNWEYIGKLWVPAEYEIFGSIIYGTKPYSFFQGVQYPIFANSYKNRLKNRNDEKSHIPWWCVTVASGNSTKACYVTSIGRFGEDYASDNGQHVPLCIRIDNSQ